MSTEFELSLSASNKGNVAIGVLFGNQSLVKLVDIEHARDIQRKLEEAIEAANDWRQAKPTGSAAGPSPPVSAQFSYGDFVYYDVGEIGRITHVGYEAGKVNYRIDYCQGKDLSTGPRGGNGPVWREGYPKPITEPSDVLFVAAMKERCRIHALTKDLGQAERNFESLKHSIELISPSKKGSQ